MPGRRPTPLDLPVGDTRRYTHQTAVIGVIIGSEGIMALWVPLLAGAWSDRLRSRIGGRLPFVVAGAVPAAAMLVLIGVLPSLAAIAGVAALFFTFYFVAYEPYRAMYPDLLEGEDIAGRAQGTQAVARGIGTGCALLGGGLLLSLARPLPFAVGGFVLLAAVGAFVVLVLRRGWAEQDGHDLTRPRHLAARLRRLIAHERALRAYLIANALWEMALAAFKAFVILYLTIGLHYELASASLIVGAVAVVILGGAAAAGKLGDRFGSIRIVRVALWAYGAGFLVLVFTTSRPLIIAAIPFVALGGGAVMTLAYAILMPLMPEHEHGLMTGFYSFSRGLGIIAGPILAGVLISITGSGPFASTHGFQAMWIVCAGAAFASLFFVGRLRRALQDRPGH
ncbi:MAG: MFS transporter [Solirubrobacterales bacterium]|nr:MFS transporter [Solirubrobacterales bacterium]